MCGWLKELGAKILYQRKFYEWLNVWNVSTTGSQILGDFFLFVRTVRRRSLHCWIVFNWREKHNRYQFETNRLDFVLYLCQSNALVHIFDQNTIEKKFGKTQKGGARSVLLEGWCQGMIIIEKFSNKNHNSRLKAAEKLRLTRAWPSIQRIIIHHILNVYIRVWSRIYTQHTDI